MQIRELVGWYMVHRTSTSWVFFPLCHLGIHSCWVSVGEGSSLSNRRVPGWYKYFMDVFFSLSFRNTLMLGVSGRRGVSLSNRRVPGWYSSTSWIFFCFCLTFRNTHHDGVSVGRVGGGGGSQQSNSCATNIKICGNCK